MQYTLRKHQVAEKVKKEKINRGKDKFRLRKPQVHKDRSFAAWMRHLKDTSLVHIFHLSTDTGVRMRIVQCADYGIIRRLSVSATSVFLHKRLKSKVKQVSRIERALQLCRGC